MPDQPKSFYLTTPIYYVNARPHIGHAYSTIVADVLARRHRLLGDETYFLTGTDEHGQKIERSAAAAGIPPQQFADQVSDTFKSLWERMSITHDQFIRTTDAKHKLGAQQLFRILYERGDIYLSSYTGQYSIGEEMFVEGPPGTLGPDGRPTETVTEENFFFRLSDYQLPLLNLIESNELLITPDSSRNEVLAFLRGDVRAVGANQSEVIRAETYTNASDGVVQTAGYDLAHKSGVLKLTAADEWYVPGALKDLSISRSSFTWGIPVPDDIQKAAGAKEKHVIYVWLDALANYITALGYGAVNEDGSAGDTTLFDKFWPADIHLVGKEITRFHCVYWPAFLLAADIKLPKQVTANGWLLFDNSKMSKSKGNVVRTETILDAFGTLCPPPLPTLPNSVILSEAQSAQSKNPGAASPATTADTFSTTEPAVPTPHDRDLFAADVLRYYLLSEIPFGQDGSFSFDSLITRYNAELTNGYGNLVSRVLNLIVQNCQGVVPQHKPFEDIDLHMGGIEAMPTTVSNYEFSEASIPNKNVKRVVIHGSYQATYAIAAIIYYEEAFINIRFASPLDPDLAKGSKPGILNAAMFVITQTDGFITATAPWKLAKEASKKSRFDLEDILYTAAESIRIITALLYPILPYATARVWQQLGLGDIEAAAANGELKNLQWGGLQPGTKLGPLGPIFPRADKGLAQIMADNEEKLAIDSFRKTQTPSGNDKQEGHEESTHPGAPPRSSSLPEPSGVLTVGGSAAHTTGPSITPSHTEAPASGIFAAQPAEVAPTVTDASPTIAIDDFVKIELRVAEVKVCERIPKADKLLRLEVDLGALGQRQILSGIAEWYTPEEMVGKRIIVIANLAPRKMRGLESHGMLLAASEEAGKPFLATVPEGVPVGTRLK